jgi:hypothetical protein
MCCQGAARAKASAPGEPALGPVKLLPHVQAW